MRPLHLFLLVLANVSWAASFSIFKVLSPTLDAGNIVALRYSLAAAILLMSWPWLPGIAPRGRDLARAIVMGVVVFTISPRLQVAGVQMGKAVDASVLMSFDPLVVSVAAAIFLREYVGPRRLTGLILSLIGVLLMSEVWRPDFHLPALVANALIVLSFVCDATYSVMGKPLVNRAGLFKVLAVAVTSGAIADFLLDGPSIMRAVVTLSPGDWLLLVYLALICTVAGYSLWFAVIKESPVNCVALTVFIQPVAGAAIAMAWLGEPLHWEQVVGCLVILTGLMIGLSRQIHHPDRKIQCR
ncbi:MAG: DMT family transporter [Limisphaerales bacterium]